MPICRSDMICKNCLYYEKNVLECRHSISFIQHTEDSWCSEGWWRQWSDITGQYEDYSFEDDEMSDQEKREENKKKKIYIAVSVPFGTYDTKCEIFETETRARLYISDLNFGKNKLFSSYWNDVDCYWKTEELNERMPN